ncbi:MAG TPA: metallophosphoesterase [Phycisphaerae bacterium]|nr:metallophosphoesterase [Phycisphaerae bacterium]
MSSSTRSFTWLHLSDLHLADNDYNQDIVTRALLRDVPDLLANDDLQPDCVFFTGDITKHGTQSEFLKAATFFRDLKKRVQPTLKSRAMLIVPGNHDVHWPSVSLTANNVELPALHDEGAVHDVFQKPERTVYLQGLQNYFEFSSNALFKGGMATMDGPLSWFWHRIVSPPSGVRVGLLGLTTSWRCCKALSQRENGNLLLGVFGLRAALDSWNALPADKQPEVIIALGHHPVSWLSEHEKTPAANLLSQRVDLYLRGHEHHAQCTLHQAMSGTHLEYAAGAIFTDDDRARRNGLKCAAGVVWPDDGAGTMHFYKFKEESGNEKWLPDRDFTETTKHTHPFPLRGAAAGPAFDRPEGADQPILAHGRASHHRRYGVRTITAVSSLCAVVLAASLLALQAFTHQTVSIPLDDTPTHLGDNLFCAIGVMEPSPVRAPSHDDLNRLIWMDKSAGTISMTTLPRMAIPFVRELQSLFARYDLTTYKHVRLIQTPELEALPPNRRQSPYVEPFGTAWLVWDPDHGNFHLQRAAVALFRVWDLKSELEARNMPYDSVSVADATILIRISHGGFPRGDGGRILLRVNEDTHDISDLLEQPDGQHPEIVRVNVKDRLNVEGDTFNFVAIATTPIQETTPIPLTKSATQAVGPAHLRDITVYSVVLQLKLTRR